MKINYLGFSNYHRRYCFEISFSDEITRIKFENIFNMNFRDHTIQAEPDRSSSFVEYVVFANEEHKESINAILKKFEEKK
ncbi:hypothetical protein GC093_20680 [Paenibacillus sp. LMG 31456]|uniref:Uncharacterized protein n=1 Tax=Paenibacillus foliorum TaxID=2654974 RepID=A0A972H3M1_9BACL|nr:hypothetical protein [Paenibacillus foliorum]NOU95626.1 hypothetical protein [Paenibacillus foliorum]